MPLNLQSTKKNHQKTLAIPIAIVIGVLELWWQECLSKSETDTLPAKRLPFISYSLSVILYPITAAKIICAADGFLFRIFAIPIKVCIPYL